MQLTRRADYALRVLLHVGAHPNERITAGRVARDFGLSAHHVSKVAMDLAHLGWLRGVRGRGGHFELAVEPDQICIGEVVRKMEPASALVECFDMASNTCPIAGVCGLERALGNAQAAFYGVLDGFTLADVLVNRRALAGRLAKAAAAAMLSAQA